MLGCVFGHLPEICQDTSGQQIGADKVRRTVAGALLVAAADVAVLFAGLCSDTAADTAHGRSRRRTKSRRTAPLHRSGSGVCAVCVTPAPVPHVSLSMIGSWWFSKMALLLDGVLYAVLDLIRRLFRFEVHQTSGVLSVFEDMNDGVGRPFALIAWGDNGGCCLSADIPASPAWGFAAPSAYGQSWSGRSRQGKAG